MEEGGSGGLSEGEKMQPTPPQAEGEHRVKRKMKTASQLEILEKTFAGSFFCFLFFIFVGFIVVFIFATSV